MSRFTRRVLGVPLVAKLIGANVLIVASAFALQAAAISRLTRFEVIVAAAALAAASAMSIFLVRLALRPIDELEQLAHRVSDGEFSARIATSPYADKDLARLTQTVNGLLDSLAQERQRIQDLGIEVMRAHDVERARVSRELHDSIAQNLAAVRFQLAAASTETSPEELRNGLATANAMISAAVEEIVNVSTALHSRVAEDLGLEAALGTLVRQIEGRYGVSVNINVSPAAKSISPQVSSTLFRVAEEALREMDMQRGENFATVNVDAGEGYARLEVAYDGVQPARPELTLMKDRVTLAGGSMTIENKNGGTKVTAEIKQLKVAS